MKIFILSLFITALSFAQVDSMRITWTDPTDADLDSIRVYADTSAIPTHWRASIAENIESYDWQPPYSGLWRVRLTAVDDSSNESTYSNTDTVTIWGSSAGTHVTANLQYYGNIDSLGSGSISSWADEITTMNAVIFGGDTTLRPIRSGNNVWFDSNDYLRSDVASMSFDGSPISIEIVLTPTDSSATEIFTARGTDFLSFSFHGNRFCAYAYDGTTEYWYNGYSLPFMGTHHIIATWDGSSNPIVYLDGVVSPAIGSPYLGLAASENRIFVGAVAAHQVMSIPLWRVYNAVLSPSDVTQNYNSASVQGLLP